MSCTNLEHLGIAKVTDLISKSYWFPCIRKKVGIHINCLKCIVFSNKTGKTEGFLHPIPKGTSPFEVFHIDHYGPINSNEKYKKHILVIIDAYTKFTRLYPTKTTSSREAIEALQNYFRSYRRSDRGSCFTSKELEEFVVQNNVMHVKIATASPQANGQVKE